MTNDVATTPSEQAEESSLGPLLLISLVISESNGLPIESSMGSRPNAQRTPELKKLYIDWKA